jgi:predicted CDP-diglyceride synthetase/phosphatidate cytidylyltransferase
VQYVSFIVFITLCAVFCLSAVCYFVCCVIVVPLPPGTNPFAGKIIIIIIIIINLPDNVVGVVCGLRDGTREIVVQVPAESNFSRDLTSFPFNGYRDIFFQG